MIVSQKITLLKSRLILLLSVLLLAIVIAAVLSVHFFNMEYELSTRFHKLIAISGEVKYHDEVLTMSALAAASTLDPEWRTRHEQHALMLNTLLTKVSVTDPIIKELIDKTTVANDKLIELELEVFSLLEKGLNKEALAILSSPEYLTYKAKYSQGLNLAMEKMLSIAKQDIVDAYRKNGQVFVLLVVVFFLIFVGLWFYLIKYIASTDKIISELIIRDELTGLLNRRTYNDDLIQELNRAQRNGYDLTLALIDIDHFKAYNDTYGHPKGDEVIRQIGSVLQNSARRSDESAYRIGGEEFAVIAHYQNREEALSQMRGIFDELEVRNIKHEYNDDHGIVTASIGIAITSGTIKPTPAELYQCADEALYKAKSAGRNRIELVEFKG